MLRRLVARLTYANVIGSIALFLALGGVSWAATKLPARSVGTTQIKDHAVTLRKLNAALVKTIRSTRGPEGPQGKVGATGAKGDKGVAGEKGDVGATGPRGAAGEKGVKGDKGDKGDQGLRGPSDAYFGTVDGGMSPQTAAVTVPAGDYIVNAVADAANGSLNAITATCTLGGDPTATHTFAATSDVPATTAMAPAKHEAIAASTVQHFATGGLITYACTGDQFGRINIVATQVSTLH